MLKFFNLPMPTWKLIIARSTATIAQHLNNTQHIGVSKAKKKLYFSCPD